MLLLLLTGAGYRDNGRPVYRKFGPEESFRPTKPKHEDGEDEEFLAIASALLSVNAHIGRNRPVDTPSI